MSSAAPRWAILIAVPALVGAVLLMHGIDAAAHTAPLQDVTAAEHHHPHPSDQRCHSCPSTHHLVIACVAVAVTIATIVRARLRPGSLPGAAAVGLVSTVRDRVARVARPPDPAWVRLGVMQR